MRHDVVSNVHLLVAGDRGYAPYQGGTNVYSVSDTLDLIRGKHNIRFGATFRAEEMNVRNNAFQDGYVVKTLATGDNIADLLLGSMGFSRLTIRPSSGVRPAVAGNCFARSYKMTGGLPII